MRGDDGDDGDEAIRFGLSCDPSLFRDPTGCPDQAPPGTGAWILPKPHGRGQIDPDRIMQGRYRTQPPPPAILRYAKSDNPAGLAGWMMAKFHDGSIVTIGGIAQALGDDDPHRLFQCRVSYLFPAPG